jgi:hypothetical protein
MSDTPRTDAMVCPDGWIVDANDVYAMERELAAMTARAEKAERVSMSVSTDMVEIAAERDEARAEALEQARLNGMGSEREARLMAKAQEARAELERLTTLFGEPVAWQERLSDSEGGWGYWYESHDRTIDDPLEEVSPGGLRIQWRPLYARAALKEPK